MPINAGELNMAYFNTRGSDFATRFGEPQPQPQPRAVRFVDPVSLAGHNAFNTLSSYFGEPTGLVVEVSPRPNFNDLVEGFEATVLARGEAQIPTEKTKAR